MHARHSVHPEIFEITNRVVNGKPSETADIARRWHSDGAFTVRPPTGSLLHCRACPDVGGDTRFSNMYMAYDRRSGVMQKLVDQLEAVNDVRGADLLTQNRTAKKVGHAWRVHDIVMWDNRCAMHVAPKDYDSSQIRHMCRTTLMGDPSGRVLRPRETNPRNGAH